MTRHVWIVLSVTVAACARAPVGTTSDAPLANQLDGQPPLRDGATIATVAPLHFAFAGTEQTMCSGRHGPPTLALAAQRALVGCVGEQNSGTPSQLIFATTAGQLVRAVPMSYTVAPLHDIRLTHQGSNFQALAPYECSPDGSWSAGQGWTCLDLHEYSDAGEQRWSWQFGQAGNNNQPVLTGPRDAKAGALSVAWVSFDNVYYRSIPAERTQTGPRDNNRLIGVDQQQTGALGQAKTSIVFDGASYAIFSVLGGHLYFSRVTANGTVEVAMRDLGVADTAAWGQLASVANGAFYYLVYNTGTAVQLSKLDHLGTVVQTVTVQGATYKRPQLVAAADHFYVLTQDASNCGYLTVYDQQLTVRSAGRLGGTTGRTMIAPTMANLGDTWMVVYNDATSGNVKAQPLTPMP